MCKIALIPRRFVGVVITLSLLQMSVVSSLGFDVIYEPAIIISDHTQSGHYKIASNGSTVYVVWADASQGNQEIFFRRSTDSGLNWASTQNLSENTTTSLLPALAVSDNNVYVAWGDYVDDFRTENILFRRSTDQGATFSPVQPLSQPSIVNDCFPQLAASGTRTYALWQDCRFTGGTGPFVRQSADLGTTFQSLQTLSPSGAAPSIQAVDENVYIAWTTGNSVIFRRSNNGGASFDHVVELFTNLNANNIQLVVTDSNVYMVWEGPTFGGQRDIIFIHSTDGGNTFASYKNLSDNPEHSSYARIAASGQNVYAVWFDETPDTANITYRRSTDSGVTFEPALNLSNILGKALFPRVAVSGNIVSVVWRQILQSSFDIMSRSSDDAGLNFAPTVKLSIANGGEPDMIASSTYLFVIWPGSEGLIFRRATTQLDKAPRISDASVTKKALNVFGQNFDDGAAILLNGENQKKVMNDEENPSTVLIAKKAGKSIAPGQTVILQIRNTDGKLSQEFRFTRP